MEMPISDELCLVKNFEAEVSNEPSLEDKNINHQNATDVFTKIQNCELSSNLEENKIDEQNNSDEEAFNNKKSNKKKLGCIDSDSSDEEQKNGENKVENIKGMTDNNGLKLKSNLEENKVYEQNNILEEEPFNKKKSSKNKLGFINSDSSDEEQMDEENKNENIQSKTDDDCTSDRLPTLSSNEESNSNDVDILKSNFQKKRIAIIDSDISSEDECINDKENEESLTNNAQPFNNQSHNKFNIDSESSDDDIERVQNLKCANVTNKNKTDNENTSQQTKKFSWLDSESSEDESTSIGNAEKENLHSQNTFYSSEDEKSRSLPEGKPVPYKKSKKIQEKRITGKDILEQRKEIQSESQRMLREKQVYLPYHKPKQRTLKEFLKNRPRFADAMPIKLDRAPASIAIKMSNKHLDIISKTLEKREEEIKEFFKSESEDSDADQENLDANEQTIDIRNDNTVSTIEGDNLTENDLKTLANTDKTEKDSFINKEDKCNNEKNLLNIGVNEINDNDKDNITQNDENIVNNTDENFRYIENTSSQDNSCNVIHDFGKSNLKEISDKESINNLELMDTSTNLKGATINEERIIADALLEPEDKSTLCNAEESKNTSIELEKIDNNEVLKNVDSDLCNKESNKSADALNKEMIHNSNTNEFVEVNAEANNISTSSLEMDIDIGEKDNDKNAEVSEYCPNVVDVIENISLNIEGVHSALTEDKSGDDKITPKLSKLALIKQQFGNTVPKLSGGPKDMIVLEDKSDEDTEVTKLMQRYFQHTSKKKLRSQTEISIINVLSTGEILKETVGLKIEKPVTDEIIEKPGVKLKQLRSELENKIALKRSELWQNKKSIPDKECIEGVHYEKKKLTDENEDDKEYLPGDDLGDEFEEEDEEDFDEGCGDMDKVGEEDENDEDNEEIEDIEFAAIIGEDEGDEDDENQNEDTDNEESSKEDANSGDIDEEDSDNEDLQKSKIVKKKRKRIINDNDDEDSDEEDVSTTKIPGKLNNTLATTESCDSDDNLPAGQHLSQTPIRPKNQTKSDLGFLTPVYHLTGLQGLNSGSKYLHDSSGSPAFKLSADTPEKNSFQKALFSEEENTQAGESFSQLVDICSGIFPTQTQNHSVQSSEISEPMPPSTQEIVELCSGNFTGISSDLGLCANHSRNLEDKKDLPLTENESNFLSTSKITPSENTNEDACINLEESDDNLITQILNDEEMREFKKKFESPIIGEEKRMETQDASLALKIQFDSSGEEEQEDDDIINIKKRKRNIIEDSDVEDESDDDDEVITNADIDEVDNEENEDFEVAYDSEENEIYEDTPKPTKTMKIKDFLENEAELSESEWESEDEDERGLDQLEIELGDAEKFDEKKIHRDLEKIHMRRILDEDKHEIKLLQEMLLEDGELHGAGRQRQFKWKNLENDNFETNDKTDDVDNVIYDEQEDEQEWRKKRHERELFLKKQLESTNSTDELDTMLTKTSQFFKLGQKAIIKDFNSTVPKTTPNAPKIKEPLSILNNKRGSFLTRPETELSKLANITKQSTVVSGSTMKNSRNFVFQSVNIENIVLNDKKRKDGPGTTPKAIKKLRISDKTLE